MVNIEQINGVKYIEIIDTEATQLKEKSKRYISNKEALLIAEKYEKIFEGIWKKYDIDIAVDKKTWLYYIIFWENALDIWLKVTELGIFFQVLFEWFLWKPIMGKRELEKYDRSKIWNFISEISWEKFLDPLYNKLNDWKKTQKSKTEIIIEEKNKKQIEQYLFNLILNLNTELIQEGINLKFKINTDYSKNETPLYSIVCWDESLFIWNFDKNKFKKIIDIIAEWIIAIKKKKKIDESNTLLAKAKFSLSEKYTIVGFIQKVILNNRL